MNLNDFYNGFTLAELMVGLVFTTLAGVAIIVGTSHYYSTINNIRLKEYAFEKLKNHTELLKARIAVSDIPSNLSQCDRSGEDLCLNIDPEPPHDCRFEANEICYYLYNPPGTIGSTAKRYELITTIKWDNIHQIEQELSFYAIQMVFPK